MCPRPLGNEVVGHIGTNGTLAPSTRPIDPMLSIVTVASGRGTNGYRAFASGKAILWILQIHMQVNMYKYPLTNMLECVKMFFS
jgi:hypothetical protein